MALPTVIRNAPILWRGQQVARDLVFRHSCLIARKQCQRYWCWAAILQEVFRCVLHSNRSQCWVAKEVRGANCDCSDDCDPSAQLQCDDTEDIENYLRSLFPGLREMLRIEVDATVFRDQLIADRAIVGLFTYDNQRHYCLITALTLKDGRAWLEVADPQLGELIDRVPLVVNETVLHPKDWALETVYFL